ncbi:MAG: DUF348 domain-containing protein [Chloroflexi bacterium]|nr:DUF348 domain-containing protein [Chloroflexota bacterium]
MSSQTTLAGLETPAAVAELVPPVTGLRLQPGFLLLSLAATIALAMTWGYSATQVPVTLLLDGHRVGLRTHQTTVGALLEEQGLTLGPVDIVLPHRSTALRNGMTITVQRGQPILLELGGRTRRLETHARSVGEALREADIIIGPRDRLFLQDEEVASESPLPRDGEARPLRLTVRRSIPVQVIEEGIPVTFDSLAPTLGQALWQEGVYLFAGDQVRPSLQTPIAPGLRVFIERGVPLTLQADGRRVPVRVVGDRVADALAQEGIALRGKDYTLPSLDTPLSAQMSIRVVRVSERFVVEERAIPFETRWVPNPETELDQWQTLQAGAEGLRRRLVRVVYEDGEEARRMVEQEWVVQEPTPRVMAYGTRIAIRELATPQGPLRYWRHLRMLATSYTAATSGKSRTHPAYGITRTGIRATRGVVAVDPRAIRLGSLVYVPGYGTALAADTGGAIKGRRIDLAYDEDKLVLWRRWVDVYLLEPVPPPEQIPWVVPAWPAER